MEISDSRQFDISKVVFLAILLVAIFAAWTYSNRRTKLQMEAEEAIFGEFGVSMPVGGGWQTSGAGGWIQQPSSFLLKKVYGKEQTCVAEVRYHLSPITADATSYLAAVSGPRQLERVAQGELEAGGVKWVWASYASGGSQAQYHYAVAPLGKERMATVFVWGKSGTWLMSESVFIAILKSSKYTDSGLLQKGAELVAAVKEQGIESIAKQLPSDVFIVKDTNGEASGFQMIRTTIMGSPQEAVIEAIYYLTDSDNRLSRTKFSSGNIEDFVWHTWNPSNPGVSAIVKVEESVMMAAVRGSTRRNEVNISGAAIAEAVVELAGWQLIKHEMSEAVVDAISYDGTITPTKVTMGKVPDKNDKWSYAVVFTSLANPKIRSEVYFDGNGVILGRTEHVSEQFVFERTTSQNIITRFPQLAGDISQFEKGSEASEVRAGYDRRPI